MKKQAFIIMLLCLIILRPAWAQEKQRALKGIEFITGYGRAELKEKEDYEIIALVVDFDFDIKPFTKKFGLDPSSIIQFQLEPFVCLATSPDANLELGISFLFKFGLVPATWKLQPYVRGGAGMIYITQHTQEQSSQFNFIPSAAAGLHYFFNQDKALTLEFRFRHLSNSSIKQPNSGIDSQFFLVGITHLF